MEPQPQTEPCRWCGGTGTYAGPMLNSFYAGPCLCVTELDDDEEE